MDNKIYTERKILTGVLLGGSLAGGYYFWRTFNAVGKPKHALASLIVATAVHTLTIIVTFIPALESIPNVVFWAVQIGLTLGAIRAFLVLEMHYHVSTAKPIYGWGNTILVSIISLVITIGVFGAIFLIAPSAFEETTAKHYGTLQHEIVYDPRNISELEVDHLADALTRTGFFDNQMQKSLDATRSGDRFILTIYCNDSARDPEAIAFHRAFRSEIQKSLSRNSIVIDMVIGTPDNRIARLE